MEAGNRCWDWNVSEMINRKIVDHISDINLPYTEHSRRYLSFLIFIIKSDIFFSTSGVPSDSLKYVIYSLIIF